MTNNENKPITQIIAERKAISEQNKDELNKFFKSVFESILELEEIHPELTSLAIRKCRERAHSHSDPDLFLETVDSIAEHNTRFTIKDNSAIHLEIGDKDVTDWIDIPVISGHSKISDEGVRKFYLADNKNGILVGTKNTPQEEVVANVVIGIFDLLE